MFPKICLLIGAMSLAGGIFVASNGSRAGLAAGSGIILIAWAIYELLMGVDEILARAVDTGKWMRDIQQIAGEARLNSERAAGRAMAVCKHLGADVAAGYEDAPR